MVDPVPAVEHSSPAGFDHPLGGTFHNVEIVDSRFLSAIDDIDDEMRNTGKVLTDDKEDLRMKRRHVILGTTAELTGLAGCSALSSQSSMLNLTVFNHTDDPYTVEMSLLRSGGDWSRSDARVYSERIDVEPQGEARRENVAETRPYLVRYSVYESNRRQTDEDHVHYYLDDGDSNSLSFDIGSTGVLTRR